MFTWMLRRLLRPFGQPPTATVARVVICSGPVPGRIVDGPASPRVFAGDAPGRVVDGVAEPRVFAGEVPDRII